MKTVCIDTTSNKEIIVSLKIDGQEFFVKQELAARKAQVVLLIIEQLLQNHSLSLQDIEAIEVNPGPGSYTGVRVGVSVANALSYALKIPVNGNLFEKKASLIEPMYSA